MTQKAGGRFRVLVAAPAYTPDRLFYPNEPGAKVVAAALRAAGFEVIHTDLHQTPEEIANAALQDDADAVVIAFYFCAIGYFLEIQDHLKEKGRTDVLLCGGGNVRNDELQESYKVGIGRIFEPGNRIQDVVAYLREEIPRRRSARP